MLDVVLCGVGRRGLEHIDVLAGVAGMRLRAVHDQSPERVSVGRARAGVPGSTDLAGVLAEAAPELVVIATPPRLRFSLVEQAVRQPSVRALLIEKPLALSLDEGDQILDACRTRGILPFVFHQLRFSAEFVRLRTAIQDGELGELRELHASCFGTLFDQGSHMVDQLCWLLGDRQPVWVSAQGVDDLVSMARATELPAELARDRNHPGAAWTHARIGFSNGVQAALSCGVLAPRPEPALGPWLQKRVVAIGSRGTAEAHVAAHFRMLTDTDLGWRTAPSDLATYRAAQQAVYAHVRDALNCTQPQPDQTQRAALELLVATQRSAQAGCLVALPLHPAPLEAAPRGRPRVSVIVPMADHRGVGLQAVRGWVEEQRCDPEDYELILLSSAVTANLEPALRAQLRPRDRLVRCEGSDMFLNDTGARLARGDILFFTEPHCLPEPETIAQTIDYLDTHAVDGLCARSVAITSTALGRAAASMFARGFEEWSKPESWVKVIVRGFAIRRAAYQDAGGFQAAYDRFAEWLLSAQLHRAGRQMAYAPGVGIRHTNAETFGLVKSEIKRFTEGECRFRVASDSPAFVGEFFGSPAEWSAARAVRQRPIGVVAASVRALSDDSALPQPRRWARRRQWVGLLASRVGAAERLLLGHQATVWHAQARYWLSVTEAQRERAFGEFYAAETALCRVRNALRLPAPEPTATALDYDLASLADVDLFGFYGVESFAQRQFRWAQPTAALKLRLPPGAYRAAVHLVGARPIDPDWQLAIFVNRTRIHDLKVCPDTWRLEFAVPASALESDTDCWLIVHAERWTHPHLLQTDPRTLSLPIARVHFEPAP